MDNEMLLVWDEAKRQINFAERGIDFAEAAEVLCLKFITKNGRNTMEKITKMTFAEARDYVEKNNEKLQAAYDAAPEFDEVPFEGKFVARGFAAFQEYLRQNESPQPQEPKVSISVRIPQSYAVGLRATGRGWQTRMSEYMVKGIQRGEFGKIVA